MKTLLMTSSLMLGICACGATLKPMMKSNWNYGIRLEDDGGPVSIGSLLTFAKPDWTDRYVRSRPEGYNGVITVEKRDDGFVEHVTADKLGVAQIDEYSVRCQGNTAVITAQATFLKDVPIMMEHIPFMIHPVFMEGAAYEITTADGKIQRGTLDMRERLSVTTLPIPPFVEAVFESCRGRIAVKVLEGPPLEIQDRRANVYSNYGRLYLLLTTKPDCQGLDKIRHVIQFTYDKNTPQAIPNTNAVAKPMADVRRLPEPRPAFPLLPKPHDIQYNGESYRPSPKDYIAVIGGSDKIRRHIAKLAPELGLSATPKENAAMRIIIGNDDEDESYTIDITAKGADIAAKSERGAFYAIQTLRGLKRNGSFQGVRITDSPDFKMRAIHAMADSDTLSNLGSWISIMLAPMKINTILLECPYVTWDAMEGQHHPLGMPKADLLKFLEIAKENYITVYPLISTLSHNQWFFQNDKNLELLDNPNDKYAYNPMNPAVYTKLEALFNEVIETFEHPKYFHISHDELPSYFPFNEDGKKVGAKELFYADIMWHYRFFKKRGIKLMMWHDMLVTKAETGPHSVANARDGIEELRNELPKDIIITTWNYDLRGGDSNNKGGVRVAEFDKIHASGFPQLGAGWFAANNLKRLSLAAKKLHFMGMIETTWHNKFLSGGLLTTQYKQVVAYPRAAALFWNAETPEQDYPKVVVDFLRKRHDTTTTLHAVPFKANILLDKTFDNLPEHVKTLDNVEFQLAKQDGQTAALSVKSNYYDGLPEKIRLPLQTTCRQIHVLHTLLDKTRRKDAVTARLVFRYTDGTFAIAQPRNNFQINYGTSPQFFDGDKPAILYEVATPYEAPSFLRNHRNVVSWKNDDGEPLNIWSSTWSNPFPEKQLDHLLVEARDLECVYCLLAVTLEK